MSSEVIRPSQETEINTLVEIWYEASLKAHHFIDEEYWKSQKNDMKEKYLPMAKTYVITNGKKIFGFLSMVDDYLAALFIDHEYQGQGYGKLLLNHIKKNKNSIQLKVFKKNEKAVCFYLNAGFITREELLDENTNEKEYLMEWKAE